MRRASRSITPRSDKVIAPGESCTLSVAINVSHDGIYIASLDAAAGTFQTSSSLAASGVHASLQLSPANDAFGDIAITSATHAPVHAHEHRRRRVGRCRRSRRAATGQYALDGTTCPATLAPAANCTFGVQFSPTALGTQNATFTASSGTLTARTAAVGTRHVDAHGDAAGHGGGALSVNNVACATPCTVTIRRHAGCDERGAVGRPLRASAAGAAARRAAVRTWRARIAGDDAGPSRPS